MLSLELIITGSLARVLWARLTNPGASERYHPHHWQLGAHGGNMRNLGHMDR